jgi:RNA polymerase sigma factor (sigma-70 family)
LVASVPPDPEKVLLSQERIERGLRVLRNLGWACREIIRMRIGEGLRYRQIAERLDRTEESVRSHMYKCLKRAKQILDAGDRRNGGSAPEAGER